MRLQANEQQFANNVYSARGDVQVDYENVRLTADRIDINTVTGWATADGHVTFDSVEQQTHVEGTHGAYNFHDETGEFDNFHGFTKAHVRGRQGTLESNNPLLFSGRRLLRLDENHYRLEDGTVTSCQLPNPKWTLSASRVDLVVGGNASLHGAAFRLRGIPVFYAPYLTHSTEREGRHSGFLMPVIGNSSIKGDVLGDSFFWAVNRSIGATFGGDYYSARGWGDHASVDLAPAQHTRLSASLDGVFDRGLLEPDGSRQNQGGQEIRVHGSSDIAKGFRTAIDGDYLSSFLYRLGFNDTIAEAFNSEVISTAFAEKQQDGYDFSIAAHRLQNFELIQHQQQNFVITTPQQQISLLQLPAVEFSSSDRPVTHKLPLYVSLDSQFGELSRAESDFNSGGMQRFDAEPQLLAPVGTPAGNFTATLSLRATYYSEHLLSPGAISNSSAPPVVVPTGLSRYSGDVDLDWKPPALERIFSSPGRLFGERLKHTIEPDVAFHYTGGVRNFDEIIRLDERDILSDTRELDYGLTQRLFSRSQAGQTREFASWSLQQKYFFDPTFGGALVSGQRNAFLTTSLLSPFALETFAQRVSPVSSVLRVSPFTSFDGDWRIDYDVQHQRVQGSAFSGHFQYSRIFFDGSHFLVRPPLALQTNPAIIGQDSFNQLRFSTGYGNAERQGLSAGIAAAYDIRTHLPLYSSLQTTYNWDCCGISILYRRFDVRGTAANVNTVLRRENQFRAMFSLANVGNFGNLKRQERIIY